MLPSPMGPCMIGWVNTVRDLLAEGKCRLADFDVPGLEAELLLARAMEVSRAYLYAHPGQEVRQSSESAFFDFIRRRQLGEPIAYLTGQREFWSLPLKVTPEVLIPRPETEILVETALARIPPDEPCRLADIGTGSGAIALAIAHERPACEVHATDISSAALEVAKDNATNLELRNIEFHHGCWFEPLRGPFDLIVSNPPYLSADDPHLNEGDLPFEPEHALISGPDGLEAIRVLSRDAKKFLRPGGWLGFEHGHNQASPSEKIMKSAEFTAIEQVNDLEGITRVTWGSLR